MQISKSQVLFAASTTYGREVKFKMAASPPSKVLSNDIGWRYLKSYNSIWREIWFYVFFVLCTFLIESTIFEILGFFLFFELFFWNCNRTIMVRYTLNLKAHSRSEIEFSISFIRGTFLIGLTVFEIFWVFWKMAPKNKQDPMLLLSWQIWYQSICF